MHPAGRREQTARFEQLCRQQGLPLTVQRRVVFEAILDRDDHPTADRIYDDVRAHIRDISRATVYRILDKFVQLGVVSRICHPGSGTRFDPKTGRHHHLVCVHCQKIIDIDDQGVGPIELPNTRNHGFQVTGYQIHFLGTCVECRARPEKGGAYGRGTGRKGTRRRQPGPKPTRPRRKRRT